MHLLIHHALTIVLFRLGNSRERVSSWHLRAEYTGCISQAHTTGHSWSPSYLAEPCGGAPPSIITEYINEQKRPDWPHPECGLHSFRR